MHPFSTAPTNFCIEGARRKWWGMCAWCSLGAAAILGEDVSFTTTLGGESKQVRVAVQGGKVLANDLYVHFPVPMRDAWNNIVHTCSLMLLFDSEVAVDEWCGRHNIAKGDVQPIQKVWEFAKVWYGNHMREDWTRATGDEVKAMFDQMGFTSDIWRLPVTKTRF